MIKKIILTLIISFLCSFHPGLGTTIPGPIRWFWSNAHTWGTVQLQLEESTLKVELSVEHGEVALRKFILNGFGNYSFKNTKRIGERHVPIFLT